MVLKINMLKDIQFYIRNLQSKFTNFLRSVQYLHLENVNKNLKYIA